jgi:hypothetical protein
VNRWTCPACGRTFGKRAQGHMCLPVRTIDDFIASQPEALQDIFSDVFDFMSRFEDVIIEPGDKYLMLKRSRTFAALTPRRKWVRMWFSLPFAVEHERIQSHERGNDRAIGHAMQLHTAEDVDDTVRAWLVEAYEFA